MPRPSLSAVLHSARSFELGPHPADPHSMVIPTSPVIGNSPTMGSFNFPPGMPIPNTNGQHRNVSEGNGFSDGTEGMCSETVQGQELWVYGGQGG